VFSFAPALLPNPTLADFGRGGAPGCATGVGFSRGWGSVPTSPEEQPSAARPLVAWAAA